MFGAAANNGQMIAEMEDGAKFAPHFSDLARLVTGRAAIKREGKGLLEPLLAYFKN